MTHSDPTDCPLCGSRCTQASGVEAGCPECLTRLIRAKLAALRPERAPARAQAPAHPLIHALAASGPWIREGWERAQLHAPWATLVTLGLLGGVALSIGTSTDAATGLGAFFGLVGIYSPLVGGIVLADAWRLRGLWRQRAGRERGPTIRTFPPFGTRCALCRCDFLPLEPGKRCRGCQTLLHAQCAQELLLGSAIRCPTLACPTN